MSWRDAGRDLIQQGHRFAWQLQIGRRQVFAQMPKR